MQLRSLIVGTAHVTLDGLSPAHQYFISQSGHKDGTSIIETTKRQTQWYATNSTSVRL